jgi:hypothetical protein
VTDEALFGQRQAAPQAADKSTAQPFVPTYVPAAVPAGKDKGGGSKGKPNLLLVFAGLLLLVALGGGGWFVFHKEPPPKQEDGGTNSGGSTTGTNGGGTTANGGGTGSGAGGQQTGTGTGTPPVAAKPIDKSTGGQTASNKPAIKTTPNNTGNASNAGSGGTNGIVNPAPLSGTLIWSGDATAVGKHVTIIRTMNAALQGGQVTGAMFPAGPVRISVRPAGSATVIPPNAKTNYNSLDLFLPTPGQQTVYIDWTELPNP